MATKKKERKLLFSCTRKDFVMQTFSSGGPGGQNQNRRSSGVRLIHKDSGARGESREHKSQKANKEAAFIRLTQSETFRTWMRIKTARIIQGEHNLREKINKQVESWMVPRNLRVEVKKDKRWETINEEVA